MASPQKLGVKCSVVRRFDQSNDWSKMSVRAEASDDPCISFSSNDVDCAQCKALSVWHNEGQLIMDNYRDAAREQKLGVA